MRTTSTSAPSSRLGLEGAADAAVRAGGGHRAFRLAETRPPTSRSARRWGSSRRRRRRRRTPIRGRAGSGSPPLAIRSRGPGWSARRCPAFHRTRARSASTRCTAADRRRNRDCSRPWRHAGDVIARIGPVSAIRESRPSARPCPAARSDRSPGRSRSRADDRRCRDRARRGAAAVSFADCVVTFMPGATSWCTRPDIPCVPRSPPGTARQEPNALSVSVAHSLGTLQSGERRGAHDRSAGGHRDGVAVDLERDRLRPSAAGVPGRCSQSQT